MSDSSNHVACRMLGSNAAENKETEPALEPLSAERPLDLLLDQGSAARQWLEEPRQTEIDTKLYPLLTDSQPGHNQPRARGHRQNRLDCRSDVDQGLRNSFPPSGMAVSGRMRGKLNPLSQADSYQSHAPRRQPKRITYDSLEDAFRATARTRGKSPSSSPKGSPALQVESFAEYEVSSAELASFVGFDYIT